MSFDTLVQAGGLALREGVAHLEAVSALVLDDAWETGQSAEFLRGLSAGLSMAVETLRDFSEDVGKLSNEIHT